MTDRPAVSVVIPTYNYARFIERAIVSVLAQTHRPAEVIVVDDGSTDETAGVVERYEPRVRYLRQENSGVSAARNAGVNASTGELVAFLDADDEWVPNKLELQVEALTGRPEAGLVACGVEEIDVDGRPLGQRLDGYGGWVAEDLLLMKQVLPMIGATAVIPRRVLETVGAFDTRLSTSADWELGVRIARRFEIIFLPQPLVRYRIHQGGMHLNVGKMEHDVLVTYDKVFADGNGQFAGIRRHALSNAFMMFAGSYFAAREYRDAARCAAQSIRLRPAGSLYAFQYPLRVLRRATGRCPK